MKKTKLIAMAFLCMLATNGPLSAQPAVTEEELLLMEAELAKEEAKLAGRRKELELLKLQQQLRKQGQQPAAASASEAAAAQVALARNHAQAQRTRLTWLAELDKLDVTMETLQKGDGRIGGPRAFGPKAKALEEKNLAARKQNILRRQQVESAILTSMQTVLSQGGSLTDDEYKWLESETKPTPENISPMDEATLKWAKTVLQIEKDRRNPPPAAVKDQPASIAVE